MAIVEIPNINCTKCNLTGRRVYRSSRLNKDTGYSYRRLAIHEAVQSANAAAVLPSSSRMESATKRPRKSGVDVCPHQENNYVYFRRLVHFGLRPEDGVESDSLQEIFLHPINQWPENTPLILGAFW